MIDSLGGRKAAVAGLIILLGVGAVFLKGDVPPNFLTLLQVVFGAFVLGNVGSKIVAARADSEPPLPVGVPVTTQDTQNHQEILKEIQEVKGAVSTVQETLLAIIQRSSSG